MKYKKIILILLTILMVFSALYMLYNMWQYSIEKSVFNKLTGVSNFDVITHVDDNRYFYITAKISDKDKQKMLNMHYYLPTPVKINGNVESNYKPVDENNYLYYLEDSGHGYLGYALYFVSKVNNTVTLYISYAD